MLRISADTATDRAEGRNMLPIISSPVIRCAERVGAPNGLVILGRETDQSDATAGPRAMT
jgi:hypothetical protein